MIRSSRSAYEGRRRSVTLMFADLRRAGGVRPPDPGTWSQLRDRFVQIQEGAVDRFGGVLGRDGGAPVLFGAPIPNEDHAQLACFAVLQVSKELHAWTDEERRTQGVNLSPCLALVQATVEVGRLSDTLHMDVSAESGTLELGTRVLQVVEHGKIYLTEPTMREVEGRFDLYDLGPFELQADAPTHLYELRGLSPLRTRVNGLRAGGTPRVIERRSVSVLNADVAGYSSLMAGDETGTLETLTAYREIIGRLVESHRGRVVDFIGDNLLAEFQPAADAVRCAAEIQDVLRFENEALPEPRRMQFRIGVHLADVMVEGERLYGDGVNIAARLERLAKPGGVCISGQVFDSVRNELDLDYEALGEQQLRNIPGSVRAYRIRPAATI